LKKLKVFMFCQVIDHLGDIGVCLRLARSLKALADWDLRIFCNQADKARLLIDPQVDRVEWHAWPTDEACFEHVPEVILCAFGCDLPLGVRRQLELQCKNPALPKTLWIHLDYLSAEPWVEDFHGLSSYKPDGLIQQFYFPGFGEKTGGLPGDPPSLLPSNQAQTSALRVFAYVYKHAPLMTWLHALNLPIDLLTTEDLANHWQTARPTIYVTTTSCEQHDEVGQAQIQFKTLAPCTQIAWDHTMLSCELLFVRGEDSWVQAMRSGIPWLWQPYPQELATMRAKLQSLLNIMSEQLRKYPHWPLWRDAQLAWGLGEEPDLKGFTNLCLELGSWQAMARAWAAYCNRLPRLDQGLCHMIDKHRSALNAYNIRLC
jgi:uncharacterized repeat protein (TIGR03837 family)